MTLLNARRTALLGSLAAAGAALALLAGCGGGGTPGTGRMQMDIGPLLQQLGGAAKPASASSSSALTPSGLNPNAAPAVTPVTALVVGAIVIDFQNTPIGENTSLTNTLKNNLTTAVENSVAYLTLVQLPPSSTTVDFLAPPPAATHWQVGAVGLRGSPATFSDITDSMPIYYGLNEDSMGNGVFLTTSSIGSTPIDITMKRACLVADPPNGCAQFTADRSAFIITPSVEIVGVYVDGASNSLAAVLTIGTDTDITATYPTQIAALLSAVGGAKTSVRVDTTHKNDSAYTSPCAPALTTSPGRPPGPGCSVESYITTF